LLLIFFTEAVASVASMEATPMNNIGCDDDEEEVDSDDMEYTVEDAIDNMILEFSGD